MLSKVNTKACTPELHQPLAAEHHSGGWLDPVLGLCRVHWKLEVLKTWSIGSVSDSIGLDGFGAKACGDSQGFSVSMIG